MAEFIEIPKNNREVFRVSLDEYQGHQMLNVRVWYRADDELRPGKQGIAVKADKVPDLLDAIKEVAA
ncbi:MAG: transcriptional coactivator p15/PC4 family protein [Pseudomonadota bacterium]